MNRLLLLLNTIALGGALAFLYYSRILYHRPPITEFEERARLMSLQASPTPVAQPATIEFEPLTVNIATNPDQPKAADGTTQQIHGKFHYATVGFSIEITDERRKDLVENVRSQVIDKLIYTLGQKQVHELTTVQGRYALRAQMVSFTNQLITSHSLQPTRESLVTNVYFTQFIVQ